MVVAGEREDAAEDELVELAANDRVLDGFRIIAQLLEGEPDEPLEALAGGTVWFTSACRVWIGLCDKVIGQSTPRIPSPPYLSRRRLWKRSADPGCCVSRMNG